MSSSAEAHVANGEKSPQFHVAHHFPTADIQFNSGKMGIWLFLVTEILLFGGMFCSFAIFRSWYLGGFVEAHHHLDRVMGGINTIVLICSSLTMALAVRAAQTTNKKAVTVLLGLTLAFAATFLVIKYFEYSHKFHDGLLPGIHFTATGFQEPREAGIFFAIYFMMTGIHGFHVLAGMGLITWILIRNLKGQFSSRYYAPVEGVGLYWHLVDLIWIYLFPLLYLVG
ncbi:cytochrome c oxidase subunit 3 family protein [Chondromyces apiculatus]|uniref:Cytochrome c oxidase polypeptide III n=1 Tax=Chondromyces apiculatus DSM 436 TaxID=1192034 RepID=A0A017TB42_9BACT|nr:cytochrome c oxidase subunit 3 family protein [Chondromyces apiculatus]EYF06503.1 Cytochrome c oxidase polypeptide III [Chondromyces apiculatus DSM 436]